MASKKEVPNNNKVTEKYNTLVSKLGENGMMKRVNLFYHVTTEDNKKQILEGGVLKGKEAAGFDKGPFNAELAGVYFSVHLEENGELPISSPYGTERIRIPIDHLLTANQHLFFAGQDNNHAILVLVDKSRKEDLKFCYDNLVELNMHDNPILCLRSTKPEGPFDLGLLGAALPGEATEPKHMVHVNNGINLEVEIFIVGDIPLATWDNVKDTGNRAKPLPAAPSLKHETPPQQTSTDEEVNEEAKLTLNAVSSGTGSTAKANVSTVAKVVAAAGSKPATTPITVAPATPPTAGKQAPGAKPTTSRQLFPKGDGDVMEDKTQTQFICDKCGQLCTSKSGLTKHQKFDKCRRQQEMYQRKQEMNH